ncbi:MAG TPA: hypothetical protein VK601_04365 [Kofleriaceae bacterium]|nr:hypothetical protein [Kofleriaceae bacterium]
MRLLFVAWWLLIAACAGAATSRPFAGTLPENAQLDLSGKFTLSPDGELRLALARPCTVARKAGAAELNCDRAVLDAIHVVAHAPWDQDVPGTWNGAAFLVFRPDWKASGLDPLADDAPAAIARVWSVSGAEWTPTPADAAAMLKLIGDATETETQVVHGGAAPNLEVTTFEIAGNVLHAGDAGTLVVRIANRGTGTAYRVVATTRSSIEALHGRRMSFGSIKPGTDKTRKLQLTVPETQTERDTMLVLALAEGNGFAPRNVSRRIAIGPSVAAPALAVTCEVEGRKATQPDLDPGQRLTLRCTVVNSGNAEAKVVELEVSVAGSAAARSPAQALAPAQRRTFDVPVVVPRGLPIDAPVEIAIVARDRTSSRAARTTIVGVVRKPTMCEPGQLTRAQYQAKITELRAAVTAGDIAQAQFDKYDAELTACLK